MSLSFNYNLEKRPGGLSKLEHDFGPGGQTSGQRSAQLNKYRYSTSWNSVLEFGSAINTAESLEKIIAFD